MRSVLGVYLWTLLPACITLAWFAPSSVRSRSDRHVKPVRIRGCVWMPRDGRDVSTNVDRGERYRCAHTEKPAGMRLRGRESDAARAARPREGGGGAARADRPLPQADANAIDRRRSTASRKSV